MMKKLEMQAVRAQLASVESLLASRTEEEDPIGWYQFSERSKSLEQEIAEIANREDNAATAALYFNGRPVSGSHGMAASFSADIIRNMQSLVWAQSASRYGELGSRGPLPQQDQSNILVTDIARGSFGFVFEEAERIQSENSSDAPVMQEVCDLLKLSISADSSSKDKDDASEVSPRVLQTLRSFFKTLEDAGASVNVVTDKSEFPIEEKDAVKAREWAEGLNITERNEPAQGRLFIIPDSRRFELDPGRGEPVIKGRVAAEWAKQMFENDAVAVSDFLGKVVMVNLRVREVEERGREKRYSYTLLGLSSSSPPPRYGLRRN